jgi:hypothetical protein
LLQYERDRVAESANANHDRFLQLIQAFTELPSATKVVASVKEEVSDDYMIIDGEVARQIDAL